ncbi:MAG: hypothetical protein V4759_05585 [Pseudomonadota bacterium]
MDAYGLPRSALRGVTHDDHASVAFERWRENEADARRCAEPFEDVVQSGGFVLHVRKAKGDIALQARQDRAEDVGGAAVAQLREIRVRMRAVPKVREQRRTDIDGLLCR